VKLFNIVSTEFLKFILTENKLILFNMLSCKGTFSSTTSKHRSQKDEKKQRSV